MVASWSRQRVQGDEHAGCAASSAALRAVPDARPQALLSALASLLRLHQVRGVICESQVDVLIVCRSNTGTGGDLELRKHVGSQSATMREILLMLDRFAQPFFTSHDLASPQPPVSDSAVAVSPAPSLQSRSPLLSETQHSP